MYKNFKEPSKIPLTKKIEDVLIKGNKEDKFYFDDKHLTMMN